MDQYLRDKHFQQQHAGQCDLLIELSLTHLSYAVIDQLHHRLQILYYSNYSSNNDHKTNILDQLNEHVETHQELKFPFRKTKVSIQSTLFTFIPTELFDHALVKDYAKFVHPTISKNQSILINDISSVGIKNLTVLEDNLQTGLMNHFDQALILNQASPFLTGVNHLVIENEKTSLAINIRSKIVEFALFHSGKLKFYNLFDCIHADELNYFILHLIKELDLNPTQTQVLLAGHIKRNDPHYERIKKYFSNIQFLSVWPLLAQSDLAEQLLPHEFFSLISLNLCE